eukprot:scaffold21726_cov59-Phaeocystis_antarctica.AAC.1
MLRVHVAPSATANGTLEVYGAPPLSVVSSEQLRLQPTSLGYEPPEQVIAEEIVEGGCEGGVGGGGGGDGGVGGGDGGDGGGGEGEGGGGNGGNGGEAPHHLWQSAAPASGKPHWSQPDKVPPGMSTQFSQTL